MNKNKYQDKSPKDLTIGEILDILTEIAKYEYSKRTDIQSIQEFDDIVQEVITYLLSKQAKGKTGLKDLQEKCTMDHFMNILHLECRNNINYVTRNKTVRRYLYNTDLLSSPAYVNANGETSDRTVGEIILDTKYQDDLDCKIELQDIISRVANVEDNSIVIKYGEGTNECIFKFSYKNLTKLYFDLYTHKRLSYNSITDLLYDKETNTKLDTKKATDLIKKFKTYIQESGIIGGLAQ